MSNLFQSLIKDCWAALNAYFNTQVGNFSILVIEAVIVFSNVSVLQYSRERSDELKAQGSLQQELTLSCGRTHCSLCHVAVSGRVAFCP